MMMLEGLFRRGARRELDAFERTFGYDVTYMREMLELSPGAFRAFSGILRLSRHREALPPEAVCAAKLTTAMAEDCGPCAQLAVTMAEREGVPAETLRAIIAGDLERLPPGAALAVRFARAALARTEALDELRAEVVRTWGPRAPVTLALLVAATRSYPLIKYALGHGQACQRLRVGGLEVRTAPPVPRAMMA
jgi:hypothetical protein